MTKTAKKTSRAKGDKYDRAIAYLKKRPESISDAWAAPDRLTKPQINAAHCLFQHATPSGMADGTCGCLTQIRDSDSIYRIAADAHLTELIRHDGRIPFRPFSIKATDLPVFAEYQRKMDQMWPGRVESFNERMRALKK